MTELSRPDIQAFQQAGEAGLAAVEATGNPEAVAGARQIYDALGGVATVAVREHERVQFMMIDSLLEDALSTRGLQLMLEDRSVDPWAERVQDAIANGELTIGLIDMRNLNVLNSLYGLEIGDAYIRSSGVALHDQLTGLARVGNGRPVNGGEDRRRNRQNNTDRMIRDGGSDEITLAFTGLTRHSLGFSALAITQHLSEYLSVESGIARDERGEPPLMGSVGVAHMADPRITQRINAVMQSDAPQGERFREVYQIVRSLADERQKTAKIRQYVELRELSQTLLQPGEELPSDERKTAIFVYERKFTQFMGNMHRIEQEYRQARGLPPSGPIN